MTELCIYQTTNTVLKINLIIVVFYGNLTDVRKERSTQKLKLVEPSIEIATINLKRKDLIKDLNFTGFIFENMCMRDLKIYADALDARLSYYRDKNDFEVDCILETVDGKWGAIEIKLGAGEIPLAAQNLIKFKDKVDTDKFGKPSFLMILTGADYSYKREDGIYIVSIGNFKN